MADAPTETNQIHSLCKCHRRVELSVLMAALQDASAPSAFLVYGALLLTQLIWSSNHVVLKLSMSVGIDPFVLPGLRAIITLPALFVCAWFKDGRESLFGIEPKKDVPAIALVGLTGIVSYQTFFNLGVFYSSVSDAGLMQPVITVITTIVSMLLGFERSSCVKLLGVLSAVAGAVLIVLGETFLAPHDPSSSSGSQSQVDTAARQRALGILCFLCSCSSFSAYILLQKPLLQRFPPLTLSFWTYVFGGAAQIVIGIFRADRVPWSALPASSWMGIAYLGLVGTVLTFFTFSFAVKYLPPSVAALGICLLPLFSSLLGTLLLHEQLTIYHLFGGLTICAGVVVVYRAQEREKREAAEQQNSPIQIDSSAIESVNSSASSSTATSSSHQPLSAFETYSQSSAASSSSPTASVVSSSAKTFNSTLSRLLMQSRQHGPYRPISAKSQNPPSSTSKLPSIPASKSSASGNVTSDIIRLNLPVMNIRPAHAQPLSHQSINHKHQPTVTPTTLNDDDDIMMDDRGNIVFSNSHLF